MYITQYILLSISHTGLSTCHSYILYGILQNYKAFSTVQPLVIQPVHQEKLRIIHNFQLLCERMYKEYSFINPFLSTTKCTLKRLMSCNHHSFLYQHTILPCSQTNPTMKYILASILLTVSKNFNICYEETTQLLAFDVNVKQS